MARSPASFSSGSDTASQLPVDDGAAVVDGVLEHRAGQHQPVHVGDGHTGRNRGGGGPQAPAGHRAVENHRSPTRA